MTQSTWSGGRLSAELLASQSEATAAQIRANSAEARAEEYQRLSEQLATELRETKHALNLANADIDKANDFIQEVKGFRRSLECDEHADAYALFLKMRLPDRLQAIKSQLLSEAGRSEDVAALRREALAIAQSKLAEAKGRLRAVAATAQASQKVAADAAAKFNDTSGIRLFAKKSRREEAEKATEIANRDADVARQAQSECASLAGQVRSIQMWIEQSLPALVEELPLAVRRQLNLRLIAETEWLLRRAHEQRPAVEQLERYLEEKAARNESLPPVEARRLSDRLAELRELIDDEAGGEGEVKVAWIGERVALLESLMAKGEIKYDEGAALPRAISLPSINEHVQADYSAAIEIPWFKVSERLGFL